MVQKKKTIFVDLEGNIGDYVTRVHIKSTTGYEDIKTLQKNINSYISVASRMEATAENCKQLWNKLTSAFNGIKHIESEAYIELREAVDEIGYDIAYVYPRKGLKTETEEYRKCMKEIFEIMTYEDYAGDNIKIHQLADLTRKIAVVVYSDEKQKVGNYEDIEYCLYASDEELMKNASQLKDLYLHKYYRN